MGSVTNAVVTDISVRYRLRKIRRMSSTRDRDAFPKTFSRCIRSMLHSTDSVRSQIDSNVLVSPISAPAFMIRDAYNAEGRTSFCRFFAVVFNMRDLPGNEILNSLTSSLCVAWGQSVANQHRRSSFMGRVCDNLNQNGLTSMST